MASATGYNMQGKKCCAMNCGFLFCGFFKRTLNKKPQILYLSKINSNL